MTNLPNLVAFSLWTAHVDVGGEAWKSGCRHRLLNPDKHKGFSAMDSGIVDVVVQDTLLGVRLYNLLKII